MVPSGRMIALAPALAAVTDTVRTTVASTNDCSAAFICVTRSVTSTWADIGRSLTAAPDRARARPGCRAYWPARRDRHGAAPPGCPQPPAYSRPSHHRIEPDDPAAAPRQRRHLAAEQRGIAGLVAVRHDHHAGARMDHAGGVPAVEGLQALADPRAAAGALRQNRQPVERARGDPVPSSHRRHGRAGCETGRPRPRETRRARHG